MSVKVCMNDAEKEDSMLYMPCQVQIVTRLELTSFLPNIHGLEWETRNGRDSLIWEKSGRYRQTNVSIFRMSLNCMSSEAGF